MGDLRFDAAARRAERRHLLSLALFSLSVSLFRPGLGDDGPEKIGTARKTRRHAHRHSYSHPTALAEQSTRGTVIELCSSRSSLSKCRRPAVSRASFLLGPVRRGSGSFVGRCRSRPVAPHRQWQWQQRAGSSVAAPATACFTLGSRRRLARLLLLLAAACRVGEVVGRAGLAFSGTARPMCARLAPLSGTWPAPRHKPHIAFN